MRSKLWGIPGLLLAASALAQISGGSLSGTLPSAVVGTPTGGNQGAGSINAQSIYVNGAGVTGNGSPNTFVSQLPNFRNALAKIRAGTGRGLIAFVGDSTGTGTGAGTGTNNLAGAFSKSQVSDFCTRLNANGVPCSNNNFFTDVNASGADGGYHGYDPRVTLGANWIDPSLYTSLGGYMFQFNTGAVNNLTFTPTSTIDTATIYYANFGNSGTFNVNFDGGSTLASGINTGASTIMKTTTTSGGVLGTHTINIVPGNNAALVVAGAIAYNSTVPAFDIINCSAAGAVVSFFTSPQAGNPNYNALPVIPVLAPSLIIIQLTINDSVNGTGVSTYQTNLQTLVTAAQNSGLTDVIVMSGIPSQTTSVSTAVLAQYVAAARAVAVASNVPFVDLGAYYGLWANTNALGWMYNNLHPNAVGYQAAAPFLANILATL